MHTVMRLKRLTYFLLKNYLGSILIVPVVYLIFRIWQNTTVSLWSNLFFTPFLCAILLAAQLKDIFNDTLQNSYPRWMSYLVLTIFIFLINAVSWATSMGWLISQQKLQGNELIWINTYLLYITLTHMILLGGGLFWQLKLSVWQKMLGLWGLYLAFFVGMGLASHLLNHFI